MKRNLCILTVIFFSFTSFVFSKELPEKLFGISLYSSVSIESFGEYDLKFPQQTLKGYVTYDVPEKNDNFEFYTIISNSDNEIHKIMGVKKYDAPNYNEDLKSEYACDIKKNSMIIVFRNLYEKARFKNLFLRDAGESTTLGLKTEIRDYNFVEYKIDDKQYILSATCVYRRNESVFQVELSSEFYTQLFLGDFEIEKYFDVTILITDTSGF